MTDPASAPAMIDLAPWHEALAELGATIRSDIVDEAGVRQAAERAWALVCDILNAPRDDVDAPVSGGELTGVAVVLGDDLVGEATGTTLLVRIADGGPIRVSLTVGERTLHIRGDASGVDNARLSEAGEVLGRT